MTQKFPIHNLTAANTTADGTKLSYDFYSGVVRLSTDTFTAAPVPPYAQGSTSGYNMGGRTGPGTISNRLDSFSFASGIRRLCLIPKK